MVNESPKSDPSRLLTAFVSAGVALVTVLIAMGGHLQQLQDHERAITDVRQEIEAHSKLEGHPLELAREVALERNQQATEAEIHALAEKIDRIDRTLVAICIATPGARCDRH